MTFLLNDDFVLRHLRPDLVNARVAPCLLGPPGIGKTMAVNALAEREDFAVFSIEVNTLSDAADLTGVRTVPDPKDPSRFIQVFFPHYTIQEANDYALAHPDVYVVILLDEINRTGSDVTSAALTLQTSRRCGNLKLAPNVRFIITGNDKGNITMLDSASLTRFSLYPVQPDARVLIRVLGDRIQPVIKDVLTEHPDWIFQAPATTAITAADDDDDDDDRRPSDADMDAFMAAMEDGQEMAQLTTPRTIEGLNLWMNEVGDELMASMASESMTGPDGQETTELMLSMIAHTGNTAFTAEVHARTVKRLLQPAAGTAPAAARVSMPPVWSSLAAATTATQVQQIIENLSVEQQGEVLIYALTTGGAHNAKAAKATVDATLALGKLTALDQTQLRELISRGTSGVLNPSTVAYFLDKDAALVKSLETYHSLLSA